MASKRFIEQHLAEWDCGCRMVRHEFVVETNENGVPVRHTEQPGFAVFAVCSNRCAWDINRQLSGVEYEIRWKICRVEVPAEST